MPSGQMIVHYSNRMEVLLDLLAQRLREPLEFPLEQEVIVLQSRGMERWLQMGLARRLGVWGNSRHPFPNAFVDEVFGWFLDDAAGAQLSREGLMWKLLPELASLPDDPAMAPLRRYLAAGEPLKRLQLAERVADCFDQYTLFRPDLLVSWERGEGEGWQPALWRRLVGGRKGAHRGALLTEFLGRAAARPAVRLPRRVILFGISYLPAFHLSVLDALSRHTEVELYALNPCREYWGDLSFRGGPGAEGNPLLASAGRTARDFFDRLAGMGAVEDGLFVDPGDDTLLRRLQSDIVRLRFAASPSGTSDGSVCVQSCHTPMREIEVLHDRLLSFFRDDPTLHPRDIVVMTPDIEAYAPYITAVFDGIRDHRRIPFTIADRGAGASSPLLAAIDALFALCRGRRTAPEFIDFLENETVAARFHLGTQELARVRSWVAETRISWGFDAEDRTAHGFVGFAENSWSAGMDRLFLSFALTGGAPFAGITPGPPVEVSDGATLGALQAAVETVAAVVRETERPRSPAQWSLFLRDVSEQLFDASPDPDGWNAWTRFLGSLAEGEEKEGCMEPLSPEEVRHLFTRAARGRSYGRGFLSGGVTFCELLPMRSIPFRVLALVGMNDGAFPRTPPAAEFDLIARHPRRGDRSTRDEDRYLFLEALLSARDRLYLSYVGQSVKDGSDIPPSVLVTELLDSLAQGYVAPEEMDGLVIRHPLQPFSPRCFDGSVPGSFSMEDFHGVQALLGERVAAPPFAGAPLPTAGTEEVALADLIAFFCNPSRYFLRRRLQMAIAEEDEGLETTEPFAVAGLDRYLVVTELAEAVLAGNDPALLHAEVRGRGVLPPGRMGDLLFEDLASSARRVAEAVDAADAGASLAPLQVDLSLDGIRLVGELGGVRSRCLLRWRGGRLSAKEQVKLAIEHLVLNTAALEGYPRESFFAGTDDSRRLSPCPDARPRLGRLLQRFQEGQLAPLPFFPETSLEYVLRLAKGEEEALAAAGKAWAGNDHRPGEASDASFRLCFGGSDPFAYPFGEVAREVFADLIAPQK